MKVIIVDDESLAIEAIRRLLNQIGGVDIKGTYTNPQEALKALQTFEVDVVFLDIEMGASHGVDIARHLRKSYADTKIVFITAHAEFAVEAFEIQAYDYLLKPVRKSRLAETIKRIQHEQQETTGEPEVKEAQLTAQVMGNFQLYKNQQEEIKWRTRKVKELFAYIWHHYPDPVPRARIMEDLWGEQHGDSAVQLMHTSFYHLRKAIRDSGLGNPVKFVNEQYILDIQIASDLDELEQLIKTSEVTDGEVERMLELYKGNYLEEENYHWTLSQQQYIKNQFLSQLEKYVTKKLDKDALVDNLEACLEKMIELDPYNERFVYLAIDYHGRTKNLPEIIRIAGRFEELWTGELRIAIPEEISSIYYKYIIRKSDK